MCLKEAHPCVCFVSVYCAKNKNVLSVSWYLSIIFCHVCFFMSFPRSFAFVVVRVTIKHLLRFVSCVPHMITGITIRCNIFCGFLGFGDFDDGPGSWGFNSSWGGGGGAGLRGNLGSRSGGLNMNMNSGGFGGLGMGRGGRPGGGGGNWASNGTGLGGGGGGGHCIHMRGLPFRAAQADIADVRQFEIFIFCVC
jgi:hypothetical protein